MKKLFKIFSLVLVMSLAIMPLAFATTATNGVPFTAQADNQVDLGIVEDATGMAMQVLTFVGYGIAVVMILWLGVQWILATPAKKAELKGKMWSMAIGILLLVGGVTILNAVYNAAGSLTSAGGN